MAQTEVFLQISGELFHVPVDLSMQILGGPFSIRLAARSGISLTDTWNALSGKLYEYVGISLPDLTDGPWKAVMGIDRSTTVLPTLYIGPTPKTVPTASDKSTIYLELQITPPIHIGGTDQYGPFTITLEPDVTIHALYFGYDNGLDFRAKISTPTYKSVTPSGPGAALLGEPGPPKYQIVTYPFPLPAQQSSAGKVKAFEFRYLGLGQRVGPNPVTNVNDPLEAIFEQLETQFTATDPATILKDLAANFYHPDRNWFIAAHVEILNWDIKVLFNDPTIYGLRVSVPMTPLTPFAGLLFEILYQKLGPNLGVYYGALTLPYLMRRIVLQGVILILPGFSIWIYTNGDFRVNIGWPLGDSSIGIQVGVLIGIAGFYFAKLRSGDNPGARPTVNYNPILLFGIGMSIYVRQGFNASIFSATIDVSLTATLQGLLAWKASENASGPPNHYWFAGTAGLSVLIQGSVDFSILKASVTISLQANVTLAFETGCTTLLAISASVSVSVSVRIIFFSITLRFNASISHQFLIGSGPLASVNGPIDKDLSPFVPPPLSARHFEALATADLLLSRFALQRGPVSEWRFVRAVVAAAAPQPVDLYFVLQPTSTYSNGSSLVELVAGLFIEAPVAGASGTAFELLVNALVNWLVDNYSEPDRPWSERLSQVSQELGSGSEPPGPAFGGRDGFASAIKDFLQTRVALQIHGVDSSGRPPFNGPTAVLPMLEILCLTYETGASPSQQQVDFGSFNRTPLNYPDAVNIYFSDLAWSGTKPTTNEVFREDLSILGPSMAAYLLYDYFLLLSRQVINGLIDPAKGYEATERQAYLTSLEAAAAGDLGVVQIVTNYCERIIGQAALRTLLDGLNYSAAAGLGSRYLLHGLQLPDPNEVPAHPTPANMRNVPTRGLYELTGQQFPASSGAQVVSATLSFTTATTTNIRSVQFVGGNGSSATTRIELPGVVPPPPSPEWRIHDASPLQLDPGVITVSPLPPLSPHALYYSLKNQVAWVPLNAGPRTILTLPQQLMDLMRREQIRLAVTTAQPDAHLQMRAAAPEARLANAPELDVVPSLLIRLTLSQVPAEAVGAVGATGSPSTGSPSTSSSPKYLPFVYEVGGTDEQTRDLIHDALNEDLSNASIQLLYPAMGSSFLQSEPLAPGTLVAKTNLSTLNQARATNVVQLLRFTALENLARSDFAPATDVKNFLRLIWEVSVVNAPGYYLFYESADGQDLPTDLFSTQGVDGNAAQFQILVQFAQPRPRPLLNKSQNCVWIPQAATANTVYGAVLTPNEDPVPQYSPTYPAGTVAFDVEWRQVVPSPPPVIPVDELYQMVQSAILPQGGYFFSNWGLPAGPTKNQPNLLSRAVRGQEDWRYTFALPISSFFGAPSPPDHNRYCVIGHAVSIGFRLADLYGNMLPEVHVATTDPLYNDPLIGLGEWPGVQFHYHIERDSMESAALILSALFDPASLTPQVFSPPGSPATDANSPTEQWRAVLDRYNLILAQLRDPNTMVLIKSTLTEGPIGDPANIRDELERFAEEIEIQVRIATVTGGSPPPDTYGGPQMVPQIIRVPIAFSAIRALKRDVIQVGVSIEVRRDPNLIDPEVSRRLPTAACITYSPIPDLQMQVASPPGSPSQPGGLSAFAQRFETAFYGFDGMSGMLKLAQSSGIQVASNAGETAPFWAVRLSPKAGIAVRFNQDGIVYFALTPLSTSLITQSSLATNLTYTDVDLDAWAYEFLQAYDAFLLPRNAVAIAILDLQNNTDYFDRLMSAKDSLAETIPRGLATVLQNQNDLGDIVKARERLTQALLESLSSAYSVSTIAQALAKVCSAGPESLGSPGRKPASLYGSVGPLPPASPDSSTGPRQYTLSNGELDLLSGDRWMTVLVSVAHAQQQSEIVLPLWYQASFLQHDFQTEIDGYVPSSWLKFVLSPLLLPVTPNKDAQIPIPQPFYPSLPILRSQTAAGVEGASSLEGGLNVENEIADALRWKYTVQIEYDWAAQDELFFTAVFNLGVIEAPFAVFEERETLFDALAFFRQQYASISGDLGTIPQEAYPGTGASSPGRAADIIRTFTTATERVACAWRGHLSGNTPVAKFLETSQVIRDEFYIRLDRDPSSGVNIKTTLYIFGRAVDGSSPEYWPRITPANSTGWSPDPQPSGSPGGWWVASHQFNPDADFDVLTLEWGPLDVLQRQTAILEAQVVRNANLLGDPANPTNAAFVYRTPQVEFRSPIVPLIRLDSIPVLQPDPKSLASTIEKILTPTVRLGQSMHPYLRIGASYEFQLGPSTPGRETEGIRSSSAILLADGIQLLREGSPITVISKEIANELAAWHRRTDPSPTKALLILSLSVFGTVHQEQLPLVTISRIPIAVSQVKRSWWAGQ